MTATLPSRVVHLELHTGDLPRARALYAKLCGWPSVLLEPREGPAGWRSVIATPEGGEIALWQQKGWRL
jgi:predicted enzyme related to lactoylglutathione lyase